MEKVKNEPDGDARNAPAESERRGWLSWLTAWRGSTAERAGDRDPTLWMHRDVTT